MFSDIYKIREIADGLCLEVEGKVSVSGRGRRAGSGFRRSPIPGVVVQSLSAASWRRTRSLFRARVFSRKVEAELGL